MNLERAHKLLDVVAGLAIDARPHSDTDAEAKAFVRGCGIQERVKLIQRILAEHMHAADRDTRLTTRHNWGPPFPKETAARSRSKHDLLC